MYSKLVKHADKHYLEPERNEKGNARNSGFTQREL